MSLLLRFLYTDRPTGEQGKLPGWLMRQIAEGSQEVFEVADRFLVVTLKVTTLSYPKVALSTQSSLTR